MRSFTGYKWISGEVRVTVMKPVSYIVKGLGLKISKTNIFTF